MACFGLKLGQDLGNRAAHPYREFRGVPSPRVRAGTFMDQAEGEVRLVAKRGRDQHFPN